MNSKMMRDTMEITMMISGPFGIEGDFEDCKGLKSESFGKGIGVHRKNMAVSRCCIMPLWFAP